MDFSSKVGFAVGTGRCGTLFLHQLMSEESFVASSHERNPDNEAFQRYCKWHGLPVDDEGFLAAKEREIRGDLEGHEFSFEASPFLSFSIKELYQRFDARFLVLVRRPDRVVTSFVHKGFYRRPYFVKNADLALGYQDQSPEQFHTFFARLAPRGEEFEAWNRMTRVGKVAWFWRAVNERILDQLEAIPDASYRLTRIEELDFSKYRETSEFFGFRSTVGQQDFDALRASKPHAFWRKRNVDQWSEQEVAEFERQVGPLAERLGYEYRVTALLDEIRAERAEAERLGHVPKKKNGPQFWRLRRAAASSLRSLAKIVDVVR